MENFLSLVLGLFLGFILCFFLLVPRENEEAKNEVPTASETVEPLPPVEVVESAKESAPN